MMVETIGHYRTARSAAEDIQSVADVIDALSIALGETTSTIVRPR